MKRFRGSLSNIFCTHVMNEERMNRSAKRSIDGTAITFKNALIARVAQMGFGGCNRLIFNLFGHAGRAILCSGR